MPTLGIARGAYSHRRRTRPHTTHRPHTLRQKRASTGRTAPTPRHKPRWVHRRRTPYRIRMSPPHRSELRLDRHYRRCVPRHTRRPLLKMSWIPKTSPTRASQWKKSPRLDQEPDSWAMAGLSCIPRWNPRRKSRTVQPNNSRPHPGLRSDWDLREHSLLRSVRPLCSVLSRPDEFTRCCGSQGRTSRTKPDTWDRSLQPRHRQGHYSSDQSTDIRAEEHLSVSHARSRHRGPGSLGSW